MKKKDDPRHKARIKVMKTLFEKSFRKDLKINDNSPESQILKKQKMIDELIIQNAPAWPINQIPPIDLATLRLAIWELLFKREKEPYKVTIDEAVEIAKEFGSGSSPSFINGVLGSIIANSKKQQEEK